MTFSQWWQGLHGFVKFLIPFLTVIAASSAATTAWVTMGLPIPATREYVNVEVGRIASSVLGLAYEQRDRLRRSRDVPASFRARSKAVATGQGHCHRAVLPWGPQYIIVVDGKEKTVAHHDPELAELE